MYARNDAYRPRSRTLAAMLMLAVLAGCSEDDPTGPDQGLLPETGADAEMEALDVRASAVAHYADGYVWASSPSTASYTPSPFYSYNRSGGANTITRQGDGLYTVRFAGLSAALGSKSTVHVTGYNSDNTYCKATDAEAGERQDQDQMLRRRLGPADRRLLHGVRHQEVR